MEPGSTFAAKHTEFTSCRCERYSHHKQSEWHDSSDGACIGWDQFWEGHWYSEASEWPAFNEHGEVLDSPPASDSLSSVSTRESSLFSWNSDHSQAAAAAAAETQGLSSPELLSSRFSGFSVLDSRIGHEEEMLCSNGCASPLVSEFHLCEPLYQEDISIQALAQNRNSTTGDLYGEQVSDSGEALSCSSTPSQDLAKEEQIWQANGMPVGRQTDDIHCDSACFRGELPSSIGFSAFLHSGDAGKPLTQANLCYSAAVKERFASSTLHGFLRFADQGGCPCYSFFVNNSDEVLFARARQERPSNRENCGWTYSFHSKKDNGKAKALWKGWPKEECLASDLVGSMRVPAIGKAKKNRDGRAKEAHFVLYDGRDQQHVEGASTCIVKQHAQPLKQACGGGNKAASQGGQAKQKGKGCNGSSDTHQSFCNRLHEEKTTSPRDACMEGCRTCINQKAELAAVVIRTSRREKRVARKGGKLPPNETAGWGVKFLDKVPACGGDLSFMERPSHDASGSEMVLSPAIPGSCKPEKSMTRRKEGKPPSNETAGWGVKFLDKVRESGRDLSFIERPSHDASGSETMPSPAVSGACKPEIRVMRRKAGKPLPNEAAGWGVAFLDKVPGCGGDLSFMERLSHDASGSEMMPSPAVPSACKPPECVGARSIGCANQSNMGHIRSDSSCRCPDINQKPRKMSGSKRSRLNIDVTVILPAGDHGLPTEDEVEVDDLSFSNGPTPLLERWASGGDCACGGWDMGCGLSVLKAETLDVRMPKASVTLTRNDRLNRLMPWSPFRISTQDHKQKKVLVVDMVEAGLFSLSFQARLSPLQAFFVAVALFHQQMTDT